jgi:hypothetical protein
MTNSKVQMANKGLTAQDLIFFSFVLKAEKTFSKSGKNLLTLGKSLPTQMRQVERYFLTA